jgi:hypothetical protein
MEQRHPIKTLLTRERLLDRRVFEGFWRSGTGFPSLENRIVKNPVKYGLPNVLVVVCVPLPCTTAEREGLFAE